MGVTAPPAETLPLRAFASSRDNLPPFFPNRTSHAPSRCVITSIASVSASACAATGGAEQPSLDALRAANATSYFKEGNSLWVKLVVDNAAGLTLSPAAGGNAPPGLAARALPVGAKLDVSKPADAAPQVAVNER